MDAIRANQIREKLQVLLEQFADQNGLSVSNIKGNFTSTDIKIAFVLGDADAIGSDEIDPEYVRNLKRNGVLYGLKLEDLDKTVNIGSRINLKFHGLRGKKACMKDRDGKIWLYDAFIVGHLIRGAK